MFLSKLGDRRDALMDGTAPPIAVFIRLYLIKLSISVDCLVHTIPVSEHAVAAKRMYYSTAGMP
jgi:hypothetical protein